MKYNSALWSAALLLLCANAHAFLGGMMNLPPHADYQRLESAHFEIVYPRINENEARVVSETLEQANVSLARDFDFQPDHRVVVVLADNDDSANGVTTTIGHQGFILLLTAADPYSVIGEYDHWLKNLAIHEYAHYLTLGQTRGVFAFLNIIFGNLIYPNHLWPTWLAEGMAVYAETFYTRQGRGHGSYFSTLTRDALYRGTLGTKEFLDFDRLSGPLAKFPFGSMPYYAGFGIMEEMTRKLGDNAVSRYAEESSWRFPYFINGGLENVAAKSPQTTGIANASSFKGLWDSWIANERRRMQPELDWIRTRGTSDPKPYSPIGDATLGARISPDETKLAYFSSSADERPALYWVELDSGRRHRIEDAAGGAGISWSKDSKTLYFSKTDYRGPLADFSELYSHSLESGSTKKLTIDERAKDPALCPSDQNNDRNDSRKLVYTTQRARISELRMLDLESGHIDVLYRAPDYHHVANPRCLGSEVYFSEHGIEPLDAIKAIALSARAPESKARHVVGGPGSGFSALFPEPTEHGIYFTRSQDGFFDLALHTASGTQIVARGSGGYWLPSAGRTKLAVSYITSEGIRASTMPLASSAIAKPPATALESHQVPGRKNVALDLSRSSSASPSSYNIFTSLAPRVWSPYLKLDNYQQQFGGAFAGWDDTDQLQYSIGAWYDSISKKPEGFIATGHRISTFRLGLLAESEVDSYISALGAREYWEERKLRASLSRQIPGYFKSFTPMAYAELTRFTRDGDLASRRVYEAERKVGARLTFSSLESYIKSIDFERGFFATAEAARYWTTGAHASKMLFRVNPIFNIGPSHGALDLGFFAGVSPNPSDEIYDSWIQVGKDSETGDLNVPLRGYSTFFTKRAGVLQAEYRLPVAQIFRGFDTFPVFARNIGVFAFYDGAFLERDSGNYTHLIQSYGAGLLLNSVLGYALPFSARLEYAHGARRDIGGEDVVKFTIGDLLALLGI